MSNQTEKVFADGFIFKRKEKAPDFVIGSQSIKVDEAIAFLQLYQKDGWVNLDIKQSKGGKYYCELDTWEPKASEGGNGSQPKGDIMDVLKTAVNDSDDMPF
jgi:hypothetical protein